MARVFAFIFVVILACVNTELQFDDEWEFETNDPYRLAQSPTSTLDYGKPRRIISPHSTNLKAVKHSAEKEILHIVTIIGLKAEEFIERSKEKVAEYCRSRSKFTYYHICIPVLEVLTLVDELLRKLLPLIASLGQTHHMEPVGRALSSPSDIKEELQDVTNEIAKFLKKILFEVRSICHGSNSIYCNIYLKGIDSLESIVNKLAHSVG